MRCTYPQYAAAMRLLLGAAAISVVALFLSPLANAAPGDQAFVDALADNGIVVGGPSLLVGNAGRKICTLAEYGWTQDMLIYSSAQYDYPQLTDSQAAVFMQLAMRTYCP